MSNPVKRRFAESFSHLSLDVGIHYRQNALSEWMLQARSHRSDASDLARYPKMTESLVSLGESVDWRWFI